MDLQEAFESRLARKSEIARLAGASVLLDAWRTEDRAAFAALNADAETMRWFPSTLDRSQSDALADRIESGLAQRGWGFWAARTGDGSFVGFVGLNIPSFAAPFMPTVEIGWRLARAHWGKGYATQAARLALDYAFGALALDEVVAFTATGNLRSRRVMERLGLQHDPADNFNHPSLAAMHPLRAHVLYRIGRASHLDSSTACPYRKDAP